MGPLSTFRQSPAFSFLGRVVAGPGTFAKPLSIECRFIEFMQPSHCFVRFPAKEH
jgi:hypothetical protein